MPEPKDTVEHEINNPLAAMLANLEFARGELAALRAHDPKRIKEVDAALRDAVLAAERIMRAVERLRAEQGPASQ